MKDRSYPFSEIKFSDAKNGWEIIVKVSICYYENEGYFLKVCPVKRWVASGKVYEKPISEKMHKDIRLYDYRKGFSNATFNSIKYDEKVAQTAFSEIENIFNELSIFNW